MSTTTKLSDEIERRLTASAGYDSLVQFHCASSPRSDAVRRDPAPPARARISCTSCRPNVSSRRERQLERRALHVVDEDVQVVGIDQRVLRRRIEEVRRVARDELIERRAARHHHRRRRLGAPAGAARALPRRRDRARIAGHHETSSAPMSMPSSSALVETTARTAPSRSPFSISRRRSRQIAAAIAADPLGHARRALEIVLQIRRQDLGREAALREDDQLQVALQELARDPARLARDTNAGCRAAG